MYARLLLYYHVISGSALHNIMGDVTHTIYLLFRLSNYSASFQNISAQLGSPLWSNFHDSTTSNLVR